MLRRHCRPETDPERQHDAQPLLRERQFSGGSAMRLQEIMNPDVVTVRPDQAASAAWTSMRRKDIRHLVVTEDSRLLGVVSERDLGGRNGAALRRGRTVSELMTPQVATATPRTTLRRAANLMSGQLIGSLPVLEDGRVVGIVTATDVLEELGRGSTRPTVRAKRRGMRVPPASARRTAAKRATPAPARGVRSGARARRIAKSPRKTVRGAKKKGRAAPADMGISGRITPTLGRERERQADSRQRAPLPARVARPVKRTAGRTPATRTPAYIRAEGSVLDDADRDYLRRKLGRRLGKFAPSIERTSVRVEDVNGPRGGIDKRCQIKVVLSGLPSVVVEERHHSLQAAMDRALDRVERAVRKSLRRRRTMPLRARESVQAIPAY